MSDKMEQFSLFDIMDTGKPYSYGFKRYIGQKVVGHFTGGGVVLTVKEIEPYYTICVDDHGREYAGINCTLSPLNPEEWNKSKERKRTCIN